MIRFKTLSKTVFKYIGLIVCFLLPVSLLAATPSLDLELTESEKLWLEKQSEIEVVGDPDWLPFEGFDEEGNYTGIVSDYLKLLEGITGLKFKVLNTATWSDSVKMAREGLVDIISETNDSDLHDSVNFTNSYLSNPIVIVLREDEYYVRSIGDIQHLRIGITTNYGYTSKIVKKYPEANYVLVDTVAEGLFAVSTGRIDAMLCTLAMCSYTMTKFGINNVKISGQTEFDTQLAFGVHSDLIELQSILNKAISNITVSQQLDISEKWIKHKIIEQFDYKLFFQSVFIFSVVLLVLIYWLRRLKKEINKRKEAETALIKAQNVLMVSKQRLSLHRQQTPLAVIDWNTEFECIGWNKSAENLFKYSEEQVLNSNIFHLIVPESYLDDVSDVWNRLMNNESPVISVNENITATGEMITCEWYNTALVDSDGIVLGVTSLVNDITSRKKQEDETRLASLVFESSSEAMVISDHDDIVVSVNSAFTTITGYTENDIIGKDVIFLLFELEDKQEYKKILSNLNETNGWQGELEGKMKSGESFVMRVTKDAIFNSNRSIYRYVQLFSDITKKKLNENIIWHQANYDSLTDLPNRNMFYERLGYEMKQSNRSKKPIFLLFLDLDRFKQVNDTLGHHAGDLLLKLVSRRISKQVRDSDTVARLSGDEFTVILTGISNRNGLESLVSNIIKSLEAPFLLNSDLVEISGTVGISCYPEDTGELDELLSLADNAMYEAKKKGRGCFCFATDKTTQKLS